MSMKKTYILIGLAIVILGVIIISSYFLYFNKRVYQYGDSKLVVGKQYVITGVLLCEWMDNKCNPPKAGPFFELCEWDYSAIDFKDVGNYPDCINVDIWNGDERIAEYEKYFRKTVKLTGIVKSIKWGVKGENCEMVQIGCERDIILFVPNKIEEINK